VCGVGPRAADTGNSASAAQADRRAQRETRAGVSNERDNASASLRQRLVSDAQSSCGARGGAPVGPLERAGRDRRPSSERQACACVESPALKGFRGRPSGELLTPVMGGASFAEVNHLFQHTYDSIAYRRSQRQTARSSRLARGRWGSAQGHARARKDTQGHARARKGRRRRALRTERGVYWRRSEGVKE